jgi:hypothetical protein
LNNPAQLLRLIGRRARELFIISAGDLSISEAEKIAAREIIAEQRRKPAAIQHVASSDRERVTEKTARDYLLAYVRALGQRLREAPSEPARKPHTEDVIAARVVPRPVSGSRNKLPENQTLVFSGYNSGATLIPDSEFHTSVTYGDRATNNWRKSIDTNARITARNRGRMIG